jgi:hypothetical protein
VDGRVTDSHEVTWDPETDPVTVPEPPTDDQLCNTAIALGFPMLATPLFQKMPHWRESMLNLHALMVRTLNGDPDAERALAVFQEAFGDRREV